MRELAGKLTAEGILRTPQWREVFLRTWRHPYVPSYYPELGAPCLLCIDPVRRGEWLAAVYSDQTLITKVVLVPHSRPLGPGSYPLFTSSSSLPSLVLTVLEALEVTDGDRVLEIGTGSGDHAALLCERLGSDRVTSVDIDPELVELAGSGWRPTVTPRRWQRSMGLVVIPRGRRMTGSLPLVRCRWFRPRGWPRLPPEG